MALIKQDVLDEARILFTIYCAPGAQLSEVRTPRAAYGIAQKAGILKLFREHGAKKRHIETALGRLFPEVNWYE